MYKKVFIDADIFIDVNDENRKTHRESLSLIPYLIKNDIGIYTSCDLITTIYYILSKKDSASALESIEKLNSFCNIIAFSNREIIQSCQLMRANSSYKDLEDTIQYILAKKEGCELIISNDTDFFSEDILLMSSKEFLESVKPAQE